MEAQRSLAFLLIISMPLFSTTFHFPGIVSPCYQHSPMANQRRPARSSPTGLIPGSQYSQHSPHRPIFLHFPTVPPPTALPRSGSNGNTKPNYFISFYWLFPHSLKLFSTENLQFRSRRELTLQQRKCSARNAKLPPIMMKHSPAPL